MGKVDIKILGLSATPVKDGNCDTYVQECLKAAEEMSGDLGKVETEFITLAGKDIAMCTNCQWCIQNKQPCKVKDDAQEIFERIIAADGLIFGAPAWGLTLSPPLTILWSRVRYYAIFTQALKNKVTGYLTVGFFGLGFDACLDQMENLMKRMMIPVARGWAVTSTIYQGDRPRYLEHGVLDDKRGMIMAQQAGVRVAEITRMIKYATEQGVVLPDEYKTTVFGGHWEKKRKKIYKDGVWREEGSGE
jgi:multimeric flavodoxin WrbA